LFNGEGGEYPATLTHIGKNNVTAKTGAWLERDSESPLEVRLAQAVSAGDKMDFTLQKAVELGIRAIQPLLAERCVVKLVGERAEKRAQHWQGVVVAACEQSGRNVVPAVAPLLTLPNWLGAQDETGLGLLLSPFAERSLSDLPPPAGPVTLLIGPEGGFSDNEVKMAASRGFIPVRLGARVLRTETAALAALAAMQALWGDF
ncbi:MAG: 16S rRNA (uracil(1498)-N(3))-methyltransferase, partial [Sulfuricellaceae bacterium]